MDSLAWYEREYEGMRTYFREKIDGSGGKTTAQELRGDVREMEDMVCAHILVFE